MEHVLGVVSDTHGYFDRQLERIFVSAGAILHAGDVCGIEVLDRLAAIAPVLAIRGNCDAGLPTDELPPSAVHHLFGVRILILHDLGRPERPHPLARELVGSERPHVVISGHSHKGRLALHERTLYLNPGSAGRKRFKLIRSAALLIIRPHQLEARLISLESPNLEIIDRRIATAPDGERFGTLT